MIYVEKTASITNLHVLTKSKEGLREKYSLDKPDDLFVNHNMGCLKKEPSRVYM